MLQTEPLTTTRGTRDDEIVRVRLIAAELRAEELVKILRAATSGAPGWRQRARIALRDIYDGRLP